LVDYIKERKEPFLVDKKNTNNKKATPGKKIDNLIERLRV